MDSKSACARLKAFFGSAVFFLAVLSASGAAAGDKEDEWAEYDYEHFYAGAQASVMLPQGGGSFRRLGGAAMRAGWYADDFLAVEASVAQYEDSTGFGLRGLWHWWGYEKFDPFFTFGATGAIDADFGPSCGWGFFWHFDDNWSFRFDADAALGLDGGCGMFYVLSAGVQYAF